MSRQEIFLVKVCSSFLLLSWYYKAFGFLIILRFFLLNIVFLPVGVLLFFVLHYFCKRCVFIHLLHLFLALFILSVLGL